jgi:hypothetical protein
MNDDDVVVYERRNRGVSFVGFLTAHRSIAKEGASALRSYRRECEVDVSSQHCTNSGLVGRLDLVGLF